MSFPPYTTTFHHSPYPAIDPSRPELSTAGKVIVVTGGGSGIGPCIANAFATSGSTKIAILGRTTSTLQAMKKELEEFHSHIEILTSIADISNEAEIDVSFQEITQAFGEIDVLVSNAGYLPDIKPISESNVEECFQGMTINVKGNLILAKAFLKYGSEKPTFVHVSTGGCHIAPMPSNSAYAVSKLAAAKMIEYFAFENPHVRVHTIHPGVIETNMSTKSTSGGLKFKFDDSELIQ
jgi:NAD(P)-dependent dehydrogenase (short-subunit alcohol dehydrogenase family)